MKQLNLLVPVHLPPSDVKANSVLLCFSFLKSTASRPEDSGLINQKEKENVSSSHFPNCLQFKSLEASQCYSFFLETVGWYREKSQQFIQRRRGGLYVLPSVLFRLCIYSWQFILFQASKSMDPSLKSCSWFRNVVFIHWSQLVDGHHQEEVLIHWSLTVYKKRIQAGVPHQGCFFTCPHISSPIFTIKVPRGTEGIWLYSSLHSNNCSDEAHLPSVLTSKVISGCSEAKLQPNTAEILGGGSSRKMCCFYTKE